MKNIFSLGSVLFATMSMVLLSSFIVKADTIDPLKLAYENSTTCTQSSISSNNDNLNLPLPVALQEQTNWCWSASSQSILAYYGTVVSQCAIANYAWSLTSCCTQPSDPATCNKVNAMWGTNGSLQGILTHYGVSSTQVASSLSESVIRTDVNSGKPFVIRWGWTGGGGHFIVGYGIDYCSNLTYMDPLSGFNTDTYSSVVSNSEHTWTHTLRVTRNPTALFSFTGSFAADNDVQKYSFSVETRSAVTLKTTSYAGGISSTGRTINRGGFDPILAIFDSTGNLITTNDDGSSCSVPADSVTGRHYDTFITVTLDPGNYFVTVMQYNNFANGPNLSNGFRHDGPDGSNFTKVYSRDNPGYFYDVTGSKRDSHWAFDVYSAKSASQVGGVKIPGAMLLLNLGL